MMVNNTKARNAAKRESGNPSAQWRPKLAEKYQALMHPTAPAARKTNNSSSFPRLEFIDWNITGTVRKSKSIPC
jgi:hypothetical protein